ncbi:restriction endonuclease subunit S [Flavobacterium sp. WC2409]|uniref:Restriction endonuclease subunit S n=2 Tax=unclassified Flavobacterium TaxID=196869 RepID=A0AB39W936_9FLAO
MREILKEIVYIKSGVFAKGDVNPDVYYVQATDFNEDKEWAGTSSPVLSKSPKLIKHFLQKDDILFAAKGKDFFAVVYDGSYQPAVASTTFLVLQLKNTNVKPEYVAWFLNHGKTQALLQGVAKGTAIKSVTISILEKIEIFIPNFAKQFTILELFNLQKKEKFLQNEISQLRQNYYNELIFKAIQ